MTKEAALYNFFSSLKRVQKTEDGTYIAVESSDDNNNVIAAYADTAVPKEAALPYVTYSVATSAFLEENVDLMVNIWCRTTSEAEVNAYVRQMGNLIPRGGTQIKCDNGAIWLKRGSPWCQNLSDDIDETIKRRYFNVTAEYLTEE